MNEKSFTQELVDYLRKGHVYNLNNAERRAIAENTGAGEELERTGILECAARITDSNNNRWLVMSPEVFAEGWITGYTPLNNLESKVLLQISQIVSIDLTE